MLRKGHLSAKINQKLTNIKNFINNNTNKNHIICLQETKTTTQDERKVTNYFRNHIPLFNHGKRNSAGIITLIPNCLRILDNKIILPGYLQATTVRTEGEPLNIINIYIDPRNFTTKASAIESLQGLDLDGTRLLAGDFNFVEKARDTSNYSDHYKLTTSFRRNWNLCLEKHNLSEAPQDAHTFFRRTYNKENRTVKITSSRLDRIYHSLDLATLTAVDCSTRVQAIPNASDHHPVLINFKVKTTTPRTSPHVPTWALKDPLFEPTFREAYDGQITLKGFKKLIISTTKIIIKTRKEAKELIPNLTVAIKGLKLALGEDFAGLDRLVERHNILKRLVSYPLTRRTAAKGIGTFVLRVFEKLGTTKTDRHPLDNRKKTLAEKIKVLLPTDRKYINGLHSLEEPNDFTSDPQELTIIAQNFWGPIWEKSEDDEQAMDNYLIDDYPQVGQLDLPTLDEVRYYIKHTNNSTHGPDGIPFLAYRLFLDITAPLIYNELRRITDPHAIHEPEFNWSLLFLIPKKDTNLIKDTRPIQVPNSDNRIISGLIKETLMPRLSTILLSQQKGFIKGRHGIENVEILTSKYYASLDTNQQKYLLLLDFRKAYDLISHTFLFKTLRAYGIPDHILQAIRYLLTDLRTNLTRPFAEGHIKITCGVKQGCPLAPLLFVLLIDTIIRKLQDSPQVTIGGFADDLGFFLEKLGFLDTLQSTIDDYCQASGSQVNQTKTILIPNKAIDASLRLTIAASRWPKIKIKPQGKYLGFLIGHKVDTPLIFDKALQDFEDRLADLWKIRKTLSVHRRIVAMNVFSLSIFSYLTMVYAFPHVHLKKVRGLIASYVIPFNSIRLEGLTGPRDLVGLHSWLREPEMVSAALLGGRIRLLRPDTEVNPNNNHPHPRTQRDATQNWLSRLCPQWRGDATTTHLTDMLRNSVVNHNDTATYLQLKLQNWFRRLRKITSLVIEPRPTFFGQTRPIATTSQKVRKRAKERENLILKGVIPNFPRKRSQRPLLIKIREEQTDTARPKLSVRDLFHNWKLLKGEVPDHIRMITLQIVHYGLATRSRVSFFAGEETHCPYCLERDDILHIYTKCPPVQHALSLIRPLAEIAYGLGKGTYLQPNCPTLGFNDFKFLDRLLAFPPCKQRTLFVLASNFSIWIAHQHALEQDLSSKGYQKEICIIFTSVTRRLGCFNYLAMTEVTKLYKSFKTNPFLPPVDTVAGDLLDSDSGEESMDDHPSLQLKRYKPYDQLPFDPADLCHMDFILLVAPEEGNSLWVGRILDMHPDLDFIEVWLYDTEERDKEIANQRWSQRWVDIRDPFGPKWKGKITHPGDKFYASKWTWRIDLHFARSLPFKRLKNGRIPLEVLRYTGHSTPS